MKGAGPSLRERGPVAIAMVFTHSSPKYAPPESAPAAADSSRWLSYLNKPVIALLVLAPSLLWSYWTTLQTMAERWSNDPQYSHGFLVPVFASVVLWHRRALRSAPARPTVWGLVVLVLAAALRIAAAVVGIEAVDAFSLLPALMGLSLLLGGWAALRWVWPAVAFLGFMLPLPFMLEMTLAHPLRQLATRVSTFVLQTLGYPALAEGNIIYIDDVKLGVIEACSGLGMLMTFFALATAMAVVIQRRLLDKLVIVVSAVPIAVIANVARVTALGIAYYDGGPAAGEWLHEWVGWLMMPLALALLSLELWYLDHVLIDTGPAAPLAIDFGGAARALPYPRKDAAPLPCDTRSSPPAHLETPSVPKRVSR
jgi:exosortase